MAKVVCEACSSEKIVVVNEMIERPGKEGTVFFSVIFALAIVCALVGFYFIATPPVSRGIIGATIIGYSILAMIMIWLFRLLQPFRYKNKTKCICLECGHTWYLGKEDKE